MKKTMLTGMVIAILALTTTAQTTKWSFDKTHSKVQFDVSHLVIAEVTGQFKVYDGHVLANQSDFSDAKINFSIDVNSISTDDDKRDGHLKSEDFFDVARYPKITFNGKSMKKTGVNQYKLTGDLTMHGVTQEVTLDVKYNGTAKDPMGNTKAGFKVMGVINRTDFGLKYNSLLEGGGLLIGEEVTITCKMELLKHK